MFGKKALRFGAAAAAATAACLLFGALPANADPVVPPYPDLAGVGSDTIQDVMNGFAAISDGTVGSWDALGTPTIQTRASGTASTPFTRPNGSSAGVKALSWSLSSPAGTRLAPLGSVDFARSSSGPTNTGTADLTFIPFAQDALSYAVHGASDFPRNLPIGSVSDPIGKMSLFNIYNCRGTGTNGALSYTNSKLQTVPVVALVPQAGSGTTKFWAELFRGTDSTPFPACVSNTHASALVQEHDGRTITGPGDITPYSIAQYIQQANHASITAVDVEERRGQAILGNVDGKKPVVFVSGEAVMNSLTALADVYPAPLKRLVYNVVATSAVTGTDATSELIQDTFLGADSLVCSNPAVIKQYGFATIGATCGTEGGTQQFTY